MLSTQSQCQRTLTCLVVHWMTGEASWPAGEAGLHLPAVPPVTGAAQQVRRETSAQPGEAGTRRNGVQELPEEDNPEGTGTVQAQIPIAANAVGRPGAWETAVGPSPLPPPPPPQTADTVPTTLPTGALPPLPLPASAAAAAVAAETYTRRAAEGVGGNRPSGTEGSTSASHGTASVHSTGGAQHPLITPFWGRYHTTASIV